MPSLSIGLPAPSIKPRFRGVLHQWACVCSVPLGVALIALAATARARIAVAVYALSLIALFGVSAAYHRVNWRSISARHWMRRLDHSMIFILIAGTYTPFTVLALHGTVALAILVAVWTGALGGAVLSVAWTQAPKWLAPIVYVAVGWIALAAAPELATALGLAALALLALGGVLYTTGAVVYATKRPDPAPATFGYHEVFHLLVIVAAAAQYAVVASLV